MTINTTWNLFANLKTFTAVAKTENMTDAGDLIGITHSSVSRQIRCLEDTLNTKLFETSSRGSKLTEEGRLFLPHAIEAIRAFEAGHAELASQKEAIGGPLKVIVSAFGMHWFAAYASEFKERYPEIDLKFQLDAYSELLYPSTASGTFVGLTTFAPAKDTPFIWTKIGNFYWYPYAHPRYLEKYGTPKTFEDLDNHKLLKYEWSSDYTYLGEKESNVLLYAGRKENDPRPHILSVDDTLGCKGMIQHGNGIGLIPKYHAQGSELVEVLKGVYDPTSSSQHSAYIVFPPHLRSNKRVVLFKDFVQEKIKENDWLF